MERARGSRLALYLGVVSLLLGILGPIALIVGVRALGRIRAAGGRLSGLGEARLGVALGALSSGLALVAIIYLLYQ